MLGGLRSCLQEVPVDDYFKISFNLRAPDIHFIGQNFEQAVWELLFNQNCSSVNCTAATGVGNALWVNHSQEDVISIVSKSLAKAMKVLGQNITFSHVVGQMHADWVTETGVADANRALAVFTHLGL